MRDDLVKIAGSAGHQHREMAKLERKEQTLEGSMSPSEEFNSKDLPQKGKEPLWRQSVAAR